MNTFLGTEKYSVFEFMVVLGLIWVGAVIYWTGRYRFSRTDFIVFAGLVVVLSACIGKFVMFPWWPVTPFELIF